MARGKKSRKGRKGRGKNKRKSNKGQIPLDVLEKRLGKLNRIVQKRGGSYY